MRLPRLYERTDEFRSRSLAFDFAAIAQTVIEVALSVRKSLSMWWNTARPVAATATSKPHQLVLELDSITQLPPQDLKTLAPQRQNHTEVLRSPGRTSHAVIYGSVDAPIPGRQLVTPIFRNPGATRQESAQDQDRPYPHLNAPRASKRRQWRMASSGGRRPRRTASLCLSRFTGRTGRGIAAQSFPTMPNQKRTRSEGGGGR